MYDFMIYTYMLIWYNIYILNMLWTTASIYAFLEWVVGFEALEEVEGLDLTRTSSNVGPSHTISSSYFSSLSIRTACFLASCWCMPYDLLGFSTQTPGCNIPVTELVTPLGNTILYFWVWVFSPDMGLPVCFLDFLSIFD